MNMHSFVVVEFLLALSFSSIFTPNCVYFDNFYSENVSTVTLAPFEFLPTTDYNRNIGIFWFYICNSEYLFLASWRSSPAVSVVVKVNVKRSPAPKTLYRNSVVNFFPIIKLVYDIETNPGPGKFRNERRRNKNNIKIAHLNVRSLKNREHFIQVKDNVISNFDIFTISETWLDNSVSNLEIEIPGYDIFRVDRQDKRGGSVCAYVRQSFKTVILNEISGISDTGLHQLWIKIQVQNLKSFLVCTAYRTPTTPVASLYNHLGTCLTSAFLLNKPIYILGDLNCNLL